MDTIINISVIIPTFNREKTILRSINSVLQQTYPHFEIIVVDDCSTDHTEELIKKIQDKRVRYIKNNRNLGPAATRNAGVRHALFDFIAFQDSDDEWLENKLEKQVNMMLTNSEYSMIYSAFMYTNEQQSIKVPDKNRNTYELLLGGNSISTQTMLIKKECFESVGAFNEELRALEDWDLAIRVAEKYKIGYIEDVLVNVYYSQNSVNWHSENLLKAQIYIINSQVKKVKNKDFLKTSILNMMERLEKGFSKAEIELYKKQIVPSIINNEFEFELLMTEMKRSRKFEENYNLLVQLSDLDNSIDFISDKFKTMRVEHVAIYGAGKVGKVLAKIISMSEVTLDYMIDQEELIQGEIKVIKKNKIENDTELILVSIPIIYNQIIEDLKQYTSAKVIYLEDFLEK